jgi:hypothetical protein
MSVKKWGRFQSLKLHAQITINGGHGGSGHGGSGHGGSGHGGSGHGYGQ